MNKLKITERLAFLWYGFVTKFRKRKFKPLDTLDDAAWQKIRQEAELLRTQHGVEVKALAKGETPDVPKPADNHSTFQP